MDLKECSFTKNTFTKQNSFKYPFEHVHLKNDYFLCKPLILILE